MRSGPTRDVTLLPANTLRLLDKQIGARFDRDGDGLLDVAIRLSRPADGWVTARCGSIDFVLVDDGDGVLRGRVEIPDVERWWPHTHGTPVLYPVSVVVGDRMFDLGNVGFRSLAVDRDADGKGFGLVVNDVAVFCRGACWTSADLVRAAVLAGGVPADPCPPHGIAGMNMIRIGGTMGYEGDAFYALCDEFGLMVWQDFAFSNFDYPATDDVFRASVAEEARQFSDAHAGIALPYGALRRK